MTTKMLAPALGALVFASFLSLPSLAHADDAAARAEALFNQAKALAEQKQYDKACPLYAESQRLDPGIGVLLYYADCLEKSGKTASAWAKFREALQLATRTGDNRDAVAKERANALEPQLARLVVSIPEEVRKTPSLKVTLDGESFERPQWDNALPADPGEHTVATIATGMKRWEGKVVVKAGRGEPAKIVVPALQADPDYVPPGDGGGLFGGADDPGHTQKIIGFATGGVGLLALGASGVFAIAGTTRYSSVDAKCDASTCVDQSSLDKRRSGVHLANIGTGFFVGGLVGLAAGVTLFATAPKRATVRVGVVPGGFVASGTF